MEVIATDFAYVDPDPGRVECIDRVLEVDLILTRVDAVVLSRNLDGDTGSDGCTKAPRLFVTLSWTDRKVVGEIVFPRHRPKINVLLAVVGDNGFGLTQGDKGAEGDGLADHNLEPERCVSVHQLMLHATP